MMSKWITYSLFGKEPRFGELLVGSLILGGASNIGTIPDGITGQTAVITSIGCVICIVLMGIKTGEQTISPMLNSKLLAGIFAIVQILYVAIGVGIVYLLRGGYTSIVEGNLQITPRVLALVSILTLGYVFTIYRTSSPSPSKKEANENIKALAELMESYRDLSEINDTERHNLTQSISECEESIPPSNFSDVNQLRDDLSQLGSVLSGLDPDSIDEIVTTGGSDNGYTSNQYNRAVNLYEGVRKDISKI